MSNLDPEDREEEEDEFDLERYTEQTYRDFFEEDFILDLDGLDLEDEEDDEVALD